jgi:hypothetical protein
MIERTDPPTTGVLRVPLQNPMRAGEGAGAKWEDPSSGNRIELLQTAVNGTGSTWGFSVSLAKAVFGAGGQGVAGSNPVSPTGERAAGSG